MRVEGSQLSSYKTDGTVGTTDRSKQVNSDKTEDIIGLELQKPENKEITPEELEKKVKQLNKAAEAMERRFQFTIHNETNRIMVRVYRKDNDELIGEFPPKKILDVLARIEKEMGLLVDTKA